MDYIRRRRRKKNILLEKIKSQKPVRIMGIKKVVIFKTKRGRVEKGIFLEEKEKVEGISRRGRGKLERKEVLKRKKRIG